MSHCTTINSFSPFMQISSKMTLLQLAPFLLNVMTKGTERRKETQRKPETTLILDIPVAVTVENSAVAGLL